MQIVRWLRHELRAVLIATLYFGACFLIFMVLKQLMLEGYGIAFSGLSTALLLALVTAKVVVVLDKAPLEHRIGLVEVAVRTTLYTAAALILLLVEKAFSAREEAGGFFSALSSVFEHPEMPHVWAAVICIGVAFAGYAAFTVLRREIGTPLLAAALLGKKRSALSGEPVVPSQAPGRQE